ncbi:MULTISPECIES: MCE family protein [Dietzia]|uniref:MCE family protein n=1 Tax=Dietzia TaxID=37914 RepID=UPI000D0881CA|nr:MULTISPECIES: MCE family protein [Dietzia]AVM64591.1 mammalian cell entry protein [Dietzia sp. oral taxon 368]MCT1712401.1 MCE family protein [Dietzia cinnamea]MCT2274159.1 MCE family protein [Dietzia cinnamea]
MARTVSRSDTTPRRIAGAGLALVIVVVVALSLLLFVRAFDSRVPLTVRSDRAGLVMEADAKVRSRGVEIGNVTDIRQEFDGATIEIEVDPAALEAVPSNAVVSIGSNTVFGAKSVDFEPPADPAPTHLEKGTVVQTTSVTTEVNTMFEELTDTLTAIEPEKLNATLGAISGGLDGRGDQIGQTITELNEYLGEINPQIETLQRDLSKGSRVAHLYADVTPDVMRVLDSGTDVGTNILANQARFEALLASAIGTGETGKRLLAENGDELVKTLADLRASTSLLAEYSPMLTCLIVGLNQGVAGAGQAFGATNQSGLAFRAGFQQGVKAYEYPKDLPKVNASTGPNCYGLPFPDSATHAPFVVTDTGTNVMEGQPNVFTSRDKPLMGPLPEPQPGVPAPPTLLQLMLGMDGGNP